MDAELLAYIFSKEGLLGQAFEEYEEREGQIAMASQVFEAYQEDMIALTEAGTGIGKSLAYLATAMLWAAKRKERTVISTYTIALQHQLIEKDIPLLQKALELDLEAVLVKGMQNYLCLRKLDEAEELFSLFSEDESRKEYDRLRIWSDESSTGCKSSLPFNVQSSTWDRYNADPDDCSSSRCPRYRDCFFFQARRKAEEAQLIVVNHHLLLHDLEVKALEGGSREKTILPPFERLIVDEAHHLEEVGFDVFSQHVDWIGLIKLMNRFLSYREDPEGRMRILQKVLNVDTALLNFNGEKLEILRKLERAFFLLRNFIAAQEKKEKRLRMQREWQTTHVWAEEIVPAFIEAVELIEKWTVRWQNLCAQASGEETVTGEILTLASRLEEQTKFLRRFFDLEADWKDQVRWIEIEEERNLHLVEATIDLAEKMRTVLFAPLRTTALCSATLCQGKDFSFVKRRLGLEKETVSEAVAHSPFDYENRTFFAVANDIPEPTARDFTEKAIQAIARLVLASQGGALVLFTANEMLKEAYGSLIRNEELEDFSILRQGELGRSALLGRFTEENRAVLLGVDSFWEGVDVPGDALRLVIIVKLPFHALQDPLIEALQEEILAKGGNPFFDYSVPRAVMKFKQGFGRLMRRKEDRGAVVCLDKRIFTKGYGKKFLDALPNTQKLFLPLEKIAGKIEFGA